MKKLANRIIYILLIVGLLSLPWGQGVQASVNNNSEVEQARALVFASKDFLELQKLSLRDGLYIKPIQQPLVFWGEEKSKRVYIAPENKHAVIFQEVNGHHIYQVFLGMQASPTFPKRAPKKKIPEGSFIFAIVDMTSRQVLIVSRVDINNVYADTQIIVWRDANDRSLVLEASAKEEGGKQNIVVRNPSTGWQAEYIVRENGVIMKVGESGSKHPSLYRLNRMGDTIFLASSAQASSIAPALSCGWICSVVCGIVGVVVCAIIGVYGLVCGIVFVVICATVCEYICS
jgi:hypothetical protein